jgi:hypothetical protein
MDDSTRKFDASTVAVLRQALNEVVADHRFLMRKSVTPLEVAEHSRSDRQSTQFVRQGYHRGL